MPTYQYVCQDCGEGLEVVQKFTDDALTECPNCQGSLRKVFSAVGIVFKGSGFYRNDSRGSGKSSTPVTSASTDKAEKSGSADKKADTPSVPAPAKSDSSPSTSASSSTSSSSVA